jgi:hypothetical protein
MTGHDTHGRRPGRSERDGDAALDAVLTVTSDRLLATLQAVLDIDGGLAAVRATDPTTAEPRPRTDGSQSPSTASFRRCARCWPATSPISTLPRTPAPAHPGTSGAACCTSARSTGCCKSCSTRQYKESLELMRVYLNDPDLR